jgi:hypothetical protein
MKSWIHFSDTPCRRSLGLVLTRRVSEMNNLVPDICEPLQLAHWGVAFLWAPVAAKPRRNVSKDSGHEALLALKPVPSLIPRFALLPGHEQENSVEEDLAGGVGKYH